MDLFSDEDIKNLSNQKQFVQKAYEIKCLQPNENDILNCLLELQYEGVGLLIHQYWNENDSTFGHQIRERFKQDFLEISQIAALEEIKNGKLS